MEPSHILQSDDRLALDPLSCRENLDPDPVDPNGCVAKVRRSETFSLDLIAFVQLFNFSEDALCPKGVKCRSVWFNLGARHNWFEQLINSRGGWAISVYLRLIPTQMLTATSRQVSLLQVVVGHIAWLYRKWFGRPNNVYLHSRQSSNCRGSCYSSSISG